MEGILERLCALNSDVIDYGIIIVFFYIYGPGSIIPSMFVCFLPKSLLSLLMTNSSSDKFSFLLPCCCPFLFVNVQYSVGVGVDAFLWSNSEA